MRLADLAGALGLVVDGDGSVEISGLAGLGDAGPEDLSFATGGRYARAFAASSGGAFIVPPDFDAGGRPALRSGNPYLDFARAVEVMMPALEVPEGVHPTAVVAPDVQLGASVSIGAYAVVGRGCRIGERSVVHPHVTLYPEVVIGVDCVVHAGARLREGTRLGDRVLVGNGAVIGSDGFGHVFGPDGRRRLIPHRCPVEIGDDCEVGANTTIDASHPGQLRRGHAETRTRIGHGTKIDNLVQIAHNNVIGQDVMITGQVGLSGSVTVGDRVIFAARSGALDHIRIGDDARLGATTVVWKDVKSGESMLGFPARPGARAKREFASLAHLPRLLKQFRELLARVGKLETCLKPSESIRGGSSGS